MSILIKAIFTVALIYYLVSRVDLGTLADSFRKIEFQWVAAAFIVVLSQVWFAARRWAVILREMDSEFPAQQVLRIVWIGIFFNQTLPSTVGGDAVRIWELTKKGIALPPAATSVVLDRVVSFGAIVLLIVASLPVLFSLIGYGPARLSLVLAALGGLMGMVAMVTLDLLPGMSAQWRLVRWVAAFARDARRILLSPRITAQVVGVSLLIALLSGVSVALLAQSIQLEVSLLACCALVPPVLLVSAIPISLAGWGLREAAMVTAFAYVDVAEADALVMSLAFGVLVMGAGLPGGLLWLKHTKVQPEADRQSPA